MCCEQQRCSRTSRACCRALSARAAAPLQTFGVVEVRQRSVHLQLRPLCTAGALAPSSLHLSASLSTFEVVARDRGRASRIQRYSATRRSVSSTAMPAAGHGEAASVREVVLSKTFRCGDQSPVWPMPYYAHPPNGMCSTLERALVPHAQRRSGYAHRARIVWCGGQWCASHAFGVPT